MIAILFLLPQVNPVNASTFNYAPLAVGGQRQVDAEHVGAAKQRCR